MKKNVIIVVLALGMMSSFMYALVQKAKADAASNRANELREKVTEYQKIIEESRQALTDALAVSETQRKLAEKAYEKAKAEDEAAKKGNK